MLGFRGVLGACWGFGVRGLRLYSGSSGGFGALGSFGDPRGCGSESLQGSGTPGVEPQAG